MLRAVRHIEVYLTVNFDFNVIYLVIGNLCCILHTMKTIVQNMNTRGQTVIEDCVFLVVGHISCIFDIDF